MKFKYIVAFLAIFYMFSTPAYAYIDPGTGSMVAQVLIAVVATCLCFIKSIWINFKNFFKKIFNINRDSK